MTKKELLKNIPADQWDKIKILNGLGEETGKIEQGKFASKEVFDSIILTNGDKEIEYEIIGEEVEKLGEQVENLSLKGVQSQGEVRNVLLIGKTGNGKSALGNVLVNRNDFEEVFRESFGSTSETKSISEETFEVPIDKEGNEKITYRIIDTIGLGDTTLTTQGVLVRLSKVAERVKKEGLNHILFVAGGRFTKEEIEAYDLLKSVIFEEKVVKHTTIVRTRFDEFEDKEACDEDRSKLREQNPEIANILMEVNIIYVDNPPLKGSKKKIDANKEERLKSREKVIKYLVCKPGNYRPENIDTLEKRVNEYQTNEQLLKSKMEELAEERKQAEEEFRKTLKNMTEEQAKVMRENDERIQDLMHNQELELKEISRQAEERERKAKQEAEAREQRMRQEISEMKKVAENQERLMKQEAERLRAEAQAKERQIKNEERRIEKMLQEQQLQGEKRLELEREKHAAEIKAQEANREIERLKYEAQIKDQEAQDAMYEAEERERDLQAQIRQEQDKSALDKFVSFKWF